MIVAPTLLTEKSRKTIGSIGQRRFNVNQAIVISLVISVSMIIAAHKLTHDAPYEFAGTDNGVFRGNKLTGEVNWCYLDQQGRATRCLTGYSEFK